MKNRTLTLLKLVKDFVLTIAVAFLATNQQNFIYHFLNGLNIKNIVFQKIVLSALVTFAIGLISVLLNWIGFKINLFVSKFLKKASIEPKFFSNNKSITKLMFKKSGLSFEERQIELELSITPAGKISLFILKALKVKIEIFFNPQVLDITLKNDSKWMSKKADVYIDESQKLCINFFDTFRLGGMQNQPFKREESILIVPKRNNSQTTYVDFKISADIGVTLCRSLTKIKPRELTVVCLGDN